MNVGFSSAAALLFFLIFGIIVLPFSVSTFAILSLYQSFQSFPGVLIEAACIDGLSDWGILTRLILPNVRSTVASLGIIQFINAWNE
ncbi:ABC transporter permease subunit [Paenibacillus rhizovicinus]|uniref:ABC transporter permease subunit n=1 Tax=Paenibacillus rhizovicinus TaxID=2704463 RepID=UPI001CDD2FC9|nr:ABC transporter permease subunit [Paenibacillus rhizovicinus]